MNKEDLIEFEDEVVSRFLNGEIKSPCHLSGGNEEQLIGIFDKSNIKPNDWVLTTYRSHYHALLKGMPKEELMKKILENKSMHIMSKEYKIVSTAIVCGTIPQAVGVAMAIKRKGEDRKVWCFLGDMASTMGVFYECYKYSCNNDLPITFVIEDNSLSTDTPTRKAWGELGEYQFDKDCEFGKYYQFKRYPNLIYYKYKRVFPHYGISERGHPEKRLFVDFDKESKT